MPAPDITLSPGQILLTQSASGLGVIPPDGKTQFGTVQKISDMCESFIVGDSVSYEASKGRFVMYGSTMYVLTNEENVSGVEVIPP